MLVAVSSGIEDAEELERLLKRATVDVTLFLPVHPNRGWSDLDLTKSELVG